MSLNLHKSVMWYLLAISAFGLLACQEVVFDETSTQVDRKLAHIHATSTPLPTPKAFDATVKVVDYQGKNNPFVSPFHTAKSSDESSKDLGRLPKSSASSVDVSAKMNTPLLGKVVQVDIHRLKQPLERYPLVQLRYAGMLEQDGRLIALIGSPDGMVHRVQVGQYMGQNHGRVVRVSREQIVVSEAIMQADGKHYEQMGYLRLLP